MPLSLPEGLEIVCATHNPGKAAEIAALLEGRFRVLTASSLRLAEPSETESTFVGNAVLKARAAADASGRIALADDSGLSAAALGGAPGVHSARWAETGTGRDFAVAMARLARGVEAAGGGEEAFFTCALAVAWPKGAVVAVEGRVDGHLVFPGRGRLGFGYDPVFVPLGESETFGEMDPLRKHALSHRARAFDKLKAALF